MNNRRAMFGRVDALIDDPIVFVEINDKKVELTVTLDNKCIEDPKLDQAMIDWDSDEPVMIAIRFSISSPVDYLVEGNTLFDHGDSIDSEAKPTFDALRAEMAAQIARIDALNFKRNE